MRSAVSSAVRIKQLPCLRIYRILIQDHYPVKARLL